MIESSLSQGMYSGRSFPKYVECTCALAVVMSRRHCKPRVYWLLSCIHQNRPPGHPHCCTACMHCLQPLYTLKTGHCKPHVYWLLSCIHQNRPPGHPHCCTACMHCLQPTQNRSLQASCVLAVVMHSPESSRPFALLHSMHALLTATVHRQNRSLQASCVLAVVHALIDIAAHCSQPLYTVKVGHCKPHVYQDTVSSKAI